MGRMRHDTVVVTSWRESAMEAAHDKAMTLMPELTTPLVETVTNGYLSFFCVVPDGAREGLELSDQYEEKRQALLDYLDTLIERREWLQYVAVRFGGDDGGAQITAANPGEED